MLGQYDHQRCWTHSAAKDVTRFLSSDIGGASSLWTCRPRTSISSWPSTVRGAVTCLRPMKNYVVTTIIINSMRQSSHCPRRLLPVCTTKNCAQTNVSRHLSCLDHSAYNTNSHCFQLFIKQCQWNDGLCSRNWRWIWISRSADVSLDRPDCVVCSINTCYVNSGHNDELVVIWDTQRSLLWPWTCETVSRCRCTRERLGGQGLWVSEISSRWLLATAMHEPSRYASKPFS